MVVVRMVKVPGYDVIDVIAMVDSLMTTVRSMLVSRFVLGAIVVRRAVGGVGLRNRDLAQLRFLLAELGAPAYLGFAASAEDVAAKATATLVARKGGHGGHLSSCR